MPDIPIFSRIPKIITDKSILKNLLSDLCSLLTNHRNEDMLTCCETCWCWDLEAIIMKYEEIMEKN